MLPRKGVAEEPDVTNRRNELHWESVYQSKADADLSWYQSDPSPSLELILPFSDPGNSVIDAGGGGSALAGSLLTLGYQVTVVDISEAALTRGRARMATPSDAVSWKAADLTEVQELGPCDVWHDRAVFHFLTNSEDQSHYVRLLTASLREGGIAVIGTFASDGPEQCSGLPVARYDEQGLSSSLGPAFTLLESRRQTHTTPWGKPQSFQWGVFRKS